MNRLSETKLRVLIGSIIVLFVFQEVMIHKYISEPYPALRMPGFSGNKMNDEGFYQTPSVEIKVEFEEEDSLELTPAEFFYNAPISHHWSLTGKFQPSDKTKELTPYKLFEIIEPVIPGYFISRQRSRYEVQHHQETIQWLREHIRGISPEKTPEKISFFWYKDLYASENLLDRQRELTGTTTIPL